MRRRTLSSLPVQKSKVALRIASVIWRCCSGVIEGGSCPAWPRPCERAFWRARVDVGDQARNVDRGGDVRGVGVADLLVVASGGWSASGGGRCPAPTATGLAFCAASPGLCACW